MLGHLLLFLGGLVKSSIWLADWTDRQANPDSISHNVDLDILCISLCWTIELVVTF